VWVCGSEFVLCVGQFVVGFWSECVLFVGEFVLVSGGECVCCEWDILFWFCGQCVYVFCGKVWCGFGANECVQCVSCFRVGL